MRRAFVLGFTAIFLLTGWGWRDRKGTFDYQLGDNASQQETAIIRPAAKSERRAPKANAAIRIFVNPGGPSTAQLLAIGSTDTPAEKLNGYGAVRVKPGTYQVSVRCLTGGWYGDFAVAIEAAAGQEQLIECVGNTAHTMNVSVFAM